MKKHAKIYFIILLVALSVFSSLTLYYSFFLAMASLQYEFRNLSLVIANLLTAILIFTNLIFVYSYSKTLTLKDATFKKEGVFGIVILSLSLVSIILELIGLGVGFNFNLGKMLDELIDYHFVNFFFNILLLGVGAFYLTLGIKEKKHENEN